MYTVLLQRLPALGVLDADNVALSVLDQLISTSLGDDLCDRRALGDLLHHLDERVGDGHTREALLTTVGTRGGVATETGNEREIEAEDVHQPIAVRTGVLGENL